MTRKILIAALLACCALHGKRKPPEPSPLDQYIAEAMAATQGGAPSATPGAIWSPGAQLTDLAGDLTASREGDIVTIVVSEQASATTSGATKTQRDSSANSSISGLAGITRATGPLANLANLGGSSKLDGSGTTSRQTAISTTLSARVVKVLPNGFLVLEGTKDVQVNSERQTVTVRGVARRSDLSTSNTVISDRLAQMEIRINGKGVVGDSIRRPMFLYRLLMGILPF